MPWELPALFRTWRCPPISASCGGSCGTATGTAPLPAAEAFAAYERNWRHVDVSRMTPEEAALARAL